MSENYVPLYSKYRPQTLENLIGQEHIKKTLTSAIELGKISHAYLFTGPRGTGKTSTARILAKSLNCKNGPTVHPCGECESCKDITNSVPIDVIEIDAASNRSVEDAQNILEKIQYVPVHGKYKIYIIDEVHMLSNHAFNALLKTLEEPPENVIFILATTEVHKVLDTIKSRCQRYDFRRITTEDIVKHLKWISEQEKINITEDALFAIAKNSAGGMRDSISLLDQLSILGISKEITIDDVNSILGRISFDILFKLSEKIFSSASSEAIEFLNEIYNLGNEPLQILTNLSEYFKNLLIAKTCSNSLLTELTGLNEPQIKELSKQAEVLETQQIVFLIERITYYIREIKQAVNQHLWLEVSVIDLSNMTENSTLADLQRRVRALESGDVVVNNQRPLPKVSTNPISKENKEITKIVSETVNSEQEKAEKEFTPPPVSKKPDKDDKNTLWQTLLSNISSPPTIALLRLAVPAKISEDGIEIMFKNDKLVKQLSESNKIKIVQQAAAATFNKNDIPVKVLNTYTESKKEEQVSIKETEQEVDKETKQEEKIIQPAPTEEKIPEKQIRQDTDQEKMIMDLFDGKYVK